MYVYVKQTQIYAYMYTRGFQSFNHLGLGLRIKEKKIPSGSAVVFSLKYFKIGFVYM